MVYSFAFKGKIILLRFLHFCDLRWNLSLLFCFMLNTFFVINAIFSW